MLKKLNLQLEIKLKVMYVLNKSQAIVSKKENIKKLLNFYSLLEKKKKLSYQLKDMMKYKLILMGK